LKNTNNEKEIPDSEGEKKSQFLYFVTPKAVARVQ
jgi:hypothetical protein